MKSLLALVCVLIALTGCGGGSTGSTPVPPADPMDALIAKCAADTKSEADHMAVDPVTFMVYVTGTARNCDGVPNGQVFLVRIPQGGSVARVAGPWENCSAATFECFPLAVAVGTDGVLHVVSRGWSAAQPSFYFRLDRSGAVLTQQQLKAGLGEAIAVGPDGRLVVNSGHLMTLTPGGTLDLVPVHQMNLPGDPYSGSETGLVDSLTVDAGGTIWFIDIRGKISRLTANGLFDMLWKVDEQASFGPLVQLSSDAAGNLYAVDMKLSPAHFCVVVKMTPSGAFSEMGSTPLNCAEGLRMAVRGNELVMVTRNWRLASMPL